MMQSQNIVPGVDMAKRKDIMTATIYATPEEWRKFQEMAAENNRREAAQLVALAKVAAQHPENFRVIKRPANGKPAYQVKTRDANPYLKLLAETVDPEGETVTLSLVVETLIRSINLQ